MIVSVEEHQSHCGSFDNNVLDMTHLVVGGQRPSGEFSGVAKVVDHWSTLKIVDTF